MGRLQELLDELRAREAADLMADDARAEQGWDSEGGPVVQHVYAQRVAVDQVDAQRVAVDRVDAQRVEDDSVSRSAPSTSFGTTDSV